MANQITETSYLKELIDDEQTNLKTLGVNEEHSRRTMARPRYWYLAWPLPFLIASAVVLLTVMTWLIRVGLADFARLSDGLLVYAGLLAIMGVIFSAAVLAVDYDTAKKAPAKALQFSTEITFANQRIALLHSQLAIEKAAALRRGTLEEPGLERLLTQLQAQECRLQLNHDLAARETRKLSRGRFRKLLPALAPLVAFSTVLASMLWLVASIGFSELLVIFGGTLTGIMAVVMATVGAAVAISAMSLWYLNGLFTHAPALLATYENDNLVVNQTLVTLRNELATYRTPQRGYIL